MAHANKTYVRNTNAPRVGANSQYADGSLSANAPLTVLGSLTHGSEITIITDGTYNFGSVSPDLLMYTDLKNATAAGTDFVPVEGTSVKTGYIGTAPTYYKGGGTYKVPLRTVSGMINSGNKAMAFGDKRTVLQCPSGGTAGGVSDFSSGSTSPQFDSLYVISKRQSTQWYFMGYFIWPAAEQENQMKNSVKNSQCKFVWSYATEQGANGGNILGLGSSSVANAYIGLPSGSGGGTVPLCAYVINSSTSVSVTISSNSISHFLQDTPSSDSARTVYLSNLSSVGNAGSAVVSNVVGNVVTLTVSGWPATGAGTLSILKLGEMQVLNRAIRQNEASIIVDSNTQYHLTRNGTAPDPFTIDPQHQIDTMYIHECWISLGTVTNKVYTRIIVPATGEIYNYTEEHDVAATMVLNYFDRMVIPGNIQGMNADPITGNPNSSVGACAYVGDVHQNYGSNSAACRVQLVDTSDNGPTTKKLANWPHKLWSPYMIKCTYMEGMFAGSSPSGNYVQIIGASNTKIAGKQV